MIDEKTLLLEIKQRFNWPVDLFRYGFSKKQEYWDGVSVVEALPASLMLRKQQAREKLDYAKESLQFLTKIPWVKAILVTGSVASDNATDNDDIDIWLHVDEKRVWLVRAIDFLFYTILGKRRLGNLSNDSIGIKNKLCFNLYTTDSGCVFESKTPSYAMQLVDAVCIYESTPGIYRRILEKNSDLLAVLPTCRAKLLDSLPHNSERTTNARRLPLLSQLFDILEFTAGFLMFLKRMHRLPKKGESLIVSRFTTWGSNRILSSYEDTITERH